MSHEEPKYDVFISYARKDGSAFAERLDHALTTEGFRTWRDTRGIDPAKDFTAEIERAIKASTHVVACITLDTERDTSFVRREIQYALLSGKRVIVARFQDILPPIQIVNNTWVEFHQKWDTALTQLCHVLRTPSGAYRQPVFLSAPADPFRAYVERLYERTVEFLDRAVIRLIHLGAEETLDTAVGSRRDMLDQFFEAQGLSEASTERRLFTTFSDAYEHYHGRVWLLGQPGAGKTITLMAHARDASAKRLSDPSAPLPLLGLISTWNPEAHRSIVEWISANAQYLNVDELRNVLEQGSALLLLDGLDELGEVAKDRLTGEEYDPRLAFLSLIPANNKAVVSCRTEVYQSIAEKLNRNGAVELLPLSEGQVEFYLADKPDILAEVRTDSELKALLRTPLLLSVFAYAFRFQLEQVATLRGAYQSSLELREAVFRKYVAERYEHELRKRLIDVAFTLPEIYGVFSLLGPLLARPISNLGRVLGSREDAFVELIVRLQLLRRDENVVRFTHTLLSEHFSFPGTLQYLEQYLVLEKEHPNSAGRFSPEFRSPNIIYELTVSANMEALKTSGRVEFRYNSTNEGTHWLLQIGLDRIALYSVSDGIKTMRAASSTPIVPSVSVSVTVVCTESEQRIYLGSPNLADTAKDILLFATWHDHGRPGDIVIECDPTEWTVNKFRVFNMPSFS